MPHTDGGETSGKYRNISPRSSSPVRLNIIRFIIYFKTTDYGIKEWVLFKFNKTEFIAFNKGEKFYKNIQENVTTKQVQ